MKTQLLAVLQANRELSKAIAALGQTWSEDPSVRNRPERTALMAALIAAAPRPMPFGDAMYAIADACEIDI